MRETLELSLPNKAVIAAMWSTIMVLVGLVGIFIRREMRHIETALAENKKELKEHRDELHKLSTKQVEMSGKLLEAIPKVEALQQCFNNLNTIMATLQERVRSNGRQKQPLKGDE